MPVGLELSWSPRGAKAQNRPLPLTAPRCLVTRRFSTGPAGRPRGPIPPAPSLLSPSALLSLERRAPCLLRAPHQQNCSCLRLTLLFEHSSWGSSCVCWVWP